MATYKQDEEQRTMADLRWRAEALARRKAATFLRELEAMSPDVMRRTIHELRVHQIELEMQNEELRQVQDKLEDARARYFDLYDLAPVGYLVLSMDGLILEANLTSADLLGETQATLVKQPISRFILNLDQDIYYLHRKRFLKTSEPYACDLRLRRRDGTAIWAHLATIPARALWVGPGQPSAGVPVYRMVMSDITERKQLQEALQREQAMLRVTQKVGRIGGWEWDPQTQGMTWTEETYRLFGCQPSGPVLGPEPLDRSLEWYRPSDRPVMESAFRRCVETGQSYTLTFRITNAQGRAFWIRTTAEPEVEGGVIVRVIGTLMEIDEPRNSDDPLDPP